MRLEQRGGVAIAFHVGLGSDAITGFPAPPAEQGPGTARVEPFRSCPS